MENRKNNLASTKICRFCLTTTGTLTNMYTKRKENKTTNLGAKILSSISVECFPSDKMPMFICERCMHFMNIVYDFKNICREADKTITEHLQTGSALIAVKWPQSLTRLYGSQKKAISTSTQQPDVGVVKIEGTTVEVSQDGSDSEEEGDNVYNVRIGDGSAEEGSACVKVVTDAGKQTPSKTKKGDYEDSAEIDPLQMDMEEEEAPPPSLKPVEGGSWACDECNNSYPLQQLLELHKMQKHRARGGYVCDVCDDKFISKYDLQTHMLRHSDETPFPCMACSYSCKREVQLRRHERLVHPELLKMHCPECPAKFMSEEDLAAHETRHRPDRQYSCVYCTKKFKDVYSLNRHKDNVHITRESLACEYCPEKFNTVAKLARHVRTHAGEKTYPCKFCGKRFAKSHHCTRHIRVKHANLVNNAEEFRCEECNATFNNQDELIYHSAIHATQNLVCPLCQEKFPDVDAVTTHIKSHVNGSEHMCDFCELMFTSEEKLEIHVTKMHSDELTEAEQMQDEDGNSMEMEAEDDSEDNAIHVKEEDDHMVVEIKKPDSFMINTSSANEEDDKANNTNSEESESESAITEAPPAAQQSKRQSQLPTMPTLIPAPAQLIKVEPPKETQVQLQNELRKREEIRRKAELQANEPVVEKKVEKPKESVGASDKSLRLLEKELQELQRTNKREEPAKTPAKPMESLRSRRPQLHTSTPKPRLIEEKKTQVQAKSTPTEKKMPVEKRGVKENKKPEETKETKTNNHSVKEDKEVKEKPREEKESKEKAKEEKETKTKEEKENKTNVSKGDNKEKGAAKTVVANKSVTEENVRRSSRASKVKDYAKMLQAGRAEATLPSDDDTDDDDDEYVESEKQSDTRPKRRSNAKQPAKAQQSPQKTPARKRGRPRKDQTQEVAAKVKKNDTADSSANISQGDEKMEIGSSAVQYKPSKNESQKKELASKTDEGLDDSKQSVTEPKQTSSPSTPVTPTTQATLKKVPIQALPPGVKPLPLPAARTVGSEISEMQIGKKVVKVQKIVMTKAEVEAMAKKGLLEMKDGTMVLKPGVKLGDPNTLKSMVGDSKKTLTTNTVNGEQSIPKAAPTRCELDA